MHLVEINLVLAVACLFMGLRIVVIHLPPEGGTSFPFKRIPLILHPCLHVFLKVLMLLSSYMILFSLNLLIYRISIMYPSQTCYENKKGNVYKLLTRMCSRSSILNTYQCTFPKKQPYRSKAYKESRNMLLAFQIFY